MLQKFIRTFHDRYPLAGPALWMLSLQYFIIQIAVGRAWPVDYSLSQNTISDLGNTACSLYGGRLVCSPLHNLMNASFIVLGATMIAGAMLIYREFRQSAGSAAGFGAMGLAGFGTAVVGFFPENTIGVLPFWGAMLPFLIGNLGIVVLGLVLDLPKSLRLYTIASGGLALVALALFLSNTYLGLGIGGMERIVAYPQTVWLIVFGMYISSSHRRPATGRPAGYSAR